MSQERGDAVRDLRKLWKQRRNIASLRRSVIAWLRKPRIRSTSGCCKRWPKLGGIWQKKKIETKRLSLFCHHRSRGRTYPLAGSKRAPSEGGQPSIFHLPQFAQVPDTPSRSVCSGWTCPCGTPRQLNK